MIKISSNTVFRIGLIYVMLPVLIMVCGFFKPVWAIAMALLLIAGGLWACRDNSSELTKRTFEVKTYKLVVMVLITLLWSYICGIGEFTWTTTDHNVRYAVLNDLTNYKWPVIYDLNNQSNPAVHQMLGGGQVAFAYYFTFWMVPALIGKACGLMAARVALVVWSAIGLNIVFLGIGALRRKIGLTGPLLFLFFGGLDIIPYVIKDSQGMIVSFEGWNSQLYIHGNFYQTMNTFNQAIPGWIIIILVLLAVNSRHIGTLASLMFCYSPWSTIGLVPIAIYEVIHKSRAGRKMRDIFTLGNIILPVAILITFGLFYTSNSGATSEKGFIWEFFDSASSLLIAYVLYIIVEFGIWTVMAFVGNRSEAKSGLMYVSLAVLAIMPIYKITHANDFLMRGTLAPMFVIFLMVLPVMENATYRIKTSKTLISIPPRALGVVGVAIVSAAVPLLLMLTTAGATAAGPEEGEVFPKDQIVSFGDIRDESWAEVCDLQFMVHDYEEKPFYKYIGRG